MATNDELEARIAALEALVAPLQVRRTHEELLALEHREMAGEKLAAPDKDRVEAWRTERLAAYETERVATARRKGRS